MAAIPVSSVQTCPILKEKRMEQRIVKPVITRSEVIYLFVAVVVVVMIAGGGIAGSGYG